MNTDDLDFILPPELIAQTPAPDRAASRLIHYRRDTGQIVHRVFSDLPAILRPGDLLVFNDARVLPARFLLRKPTGGRIEGLFLDEPHPSQWHVLLRDLGDAPTRMTLHFESNPNLSATLLQKLGGGEYLLRVSGSDSAQNILQQIGRMPLPPYIKRDKTSDQRDALDRDRYQTVYARSSGAVAAPTAGLHFTPSLLQQLDKTAIQRTTITLHVGIGTFKPITTPTLEAHQMHSERYSIPATTAQALNQAKKDHRRIIAVGTTSARVLESQPADQPFAPTEAQTSIFIHPPYQWKHVDALLTNFHLPRSTLIALVAAMTTPERQRHIYRQAIEERYRFFSYGDSMLIE